MNRFKTIFLSLSLFMAGNVFQSCSDLDSPYDADLQTAVVTVRQTDDNGVVLKLDKNTTLRPTNMSKYPYSKKAVRALVRYKTGETVTSASQDYPVVVNLLDSICTKYPVLTAGEENAKKYGDDPIEIVRDWVTLAEDDFLTLRIRTVWGYTGNKHMINLVQGTNPENPLEFELRHDANGDTYGNYGDALVAFDLGKVSDEDLSGKTITLVWKSFEGKKTVDFVMDAPLADQENPDNGKMTEMRTNLVR